MLFVQALPADGEAGSSMLANRPWTDWIVHGSRSDLRGAMALATRRAERGCPVFRLVPAAVVVLQAILVSINLPVWEVWTEKPILHIDSAYHAYQIHLARILWKTHSVIGYDPHFAAGYLGGIPFNASARISALIGLFLSGPSAPFIAYKIFLLAASILAVAMIPLACRSLRLDDRATAVASVFAVFMWWATPIRWYFVAGMASYVAAAFLAIPFACWVRSILIERGTLRAIGAGLVGGLGLFCHPDFPFMSAPLALILVAPHWRECRNWGTLRSVLIIAGLAAGLNLWWVLEMVSYPGFFDAAKQPYQQIVDVLIPFAEPLGIASTARGGSRFYLVLVVGAAWSLVSPKLRSVTIPLVVAVIFFLVLASVGSLVPAIAVLQPNRFSAFAWLILTIPAGVGVAELLARISDQGVRSAWVFGSSGFIVVGTLFYVAEAARELSPHSKAYYGVRPPEITGEGPIATGVLAWLRANASTDGRILFEQSRGRIHDGVHLAPFLAQMTGFEFIGGPYPYQHFATFLDGRLFGKEIAAMDPEDLKEYLRVYNIRWVICHSSSARAVFGRSPWVETAMEAEWGTIFRIKQPSTYFIRGKGSIDDRSANMIKGRIDSGTSALLSYHWSPRLRVIPEAKVAKEWVRDDPVPFIRLEMPAGPFEVRFAAEADRWEW